MLTVTELSAGYGDLEIVRSLTMTIAPGECVAVLGPNGAGKTTTLRALVGDLPARRGRIELDGREITRDPTHIRVRSGVVLVPQDRSLFAQMSVLDNLRVPMDAHAPRASSTDAASHWDLERVVELFPILGDRKNQMAGAMSGGEQQMLAIARALLCQPRYLLLDEPLGLAPVIVKQLMGVLEGLKASRIGIVLVEQQVDAALSVADRALFLQRGNIVLEGAASELRNDDALVRSFMGGAA